MFSARRTLLALCVQISVLDSIPAQPCNVSTIAGRTAAFSGDNGPALNAHLFGASETAVGPDGRILFIDRMNRRIRAFTPGGSISTVAGSGAYGDSGDNGPATSATFKSLISLAVDRSGNIFIADYEARRIRKINADGIITHFAGTGIARYSGDNGPAVTAEFASIEAIASGPDGSLFVLDGAERCVRRIDADGQIARYAGKRNSSSSLGPRDPLDFTGPALEASFPRPSSIAVDGAGNLFVADSIDSVIRKITPQGIISRFAGNGLNGATGDGGPATAASVKPAWISIDRDGTIYTQDSNFPLRIRRVLPSGRIEAFANGNFSRGVALDGALLAGQHDVVVRITSNGNLERVAGIPARGYTQDNQPALGAAFGLATNSGLIVRPDGALLFTDTNNLRVRALLPDGTITTLAGGGSIAPADGIPATSVRLISLGGIGVDAAGAIYFTSPLLNAIYKVSTDGILIKIGGTGAPYVPGPFDVGNPAIQVPFRFPQSIAVTPNGDVYVRQDGNLSGIYKIQGSDGRLVIVPLPNVTLPILGPISVDLDGNVFIAHSDSRTLFRISSDGAVSKIAIAPLLDSSLRSGLAIGPQNIIAASSPWSFRLSSGPETIMALGRTTVLMEGSPEDGPLSELRLGTVGAVAFDKESNLLFVDIDGQRIRRISAGCPVTAQPFVTAVTDGATFSLANGFAPGTLSTLFGVHLGPTEGQGTKLDEQGRVVTELAGTRVLVDGVPAPLLYTSATQVNFVVPFSMEGRSLFYLQTEFNGVLSEPKVVHGRAANPELFVFGKSMWGDLTFLNSDWTVNSESNPAKKGSSVIAFATGFGQTMPAGVDGLPNSAPFPRPVLPVTATIGEMAMPIEYAGGAPGFVAGLIQLNLRIPENLLDSLYVIRITVGESDPRDPSHVEARVFVR